MVQKINPHPAPGCNRSPPTMYFQKMQFFGAFRPFLQRSLNWATLEPSDSIKGVARKQDAVIIQNNSW